METILQQMIAHKESIQLRQKQQELIASGAAVKARRRSASNSLVDEPKYWRERARIVRSLTINMKAAESRRVMAKIAEHYEKLAERVEKNRGSLKRITSSGS
jgi:hypothetical protein